MNPQQLLDALHATGVFSETWNQSTKKERVVQIKSYRAQLREIKANLRSVQNSIKKRYDGRNSFEAREEASQLLPYELIDSLVYKLETYLARVESGEEVSLEKIGTILYGSFDKDFWAIGTPVDAEKYELKNKLEHLHSSIKQDIAALKRKTHSYHSKSLILLGVVCCIVGLVFLFGFPQISFFDSFRDLNFVIIGTVQIILGLGLFYIFRVRREKLKKEINDLRIKIREAKAEFAKLKTTYSTLK
jgi:hypothetical protein